MLHPFELFKPVYVPRLLELERYFLVTQTYHRYACPLWEQKTNLLLTDYADSNMAKTHLQALHADPFAAIINLQHPPHKIKLLEMMGEGASYRLFWAVVKSTKELEEKVNRSYKENMKRYIETHTSWHISRDTALRPSIQMVFGELFIIMKHGNNTLRVKFEEVENA